MVVIVGGVEIQRFKVTEIVVNVGGQEAGVL